MRDSLSRSMIEDSSHEGSPLEKKNQIPFALYVRLLEKIIVDRPEIISDIAENMGIDIRIVRRQQLLNQVQKEDKVDKLVTVFGVSSMDEVLEKLHTLSSEDLTEIFFEKLEIDAFCLSDKEGEIFGLLRLIRNKQMDARFRASFIAVAGTEEILRFGKQVSIGDIFGTLEF